VNNLFDKEPLATFGGLPGNTDSGTYDPLGRRFFVSVTGRFH
jgi:outer membrane receptor protein involved in Fe transport